MDLNLVEVLRERPLIALVGATNDAAKFGNIILKDLLRKNYSVVPINPRATTVEGITAYPSLTAARENHDLGLVVYVVPPKLTLASLAEAKELGLNRVWVQPGAGDEQVREYLESNDFAYLMNACVMVQAAS